MAKKPTEHAVRIQPHMQKIVDGIHQTLKAAGVKGVRVHSIQFKAAGKAASFSAITSGCVTLPDGTIHCG